MFLINISLLLYNLYLLSNINATIDVLTTQITTRYKAIFKNDPTFREPDNVILKSSDDLILFGEDLIKDVLSDMCQVNYKKKTNDCL